MVKLKGKYDLEIIVVDNNSLDDFTEIHTSFKNEIVFVRNNENIGFGAANNIGVRMATYDSILILNPDTIISDNLINTGLAYLDDDQCGAVAFKMIDGNGQYLPESKRRLPSIRSSIWKLIGLDKYQKSDGYYHNSQSKTSKIEVLSGACFMMRKDIYMGIGGFDEIYFMYGEDIDISFQLQKFGYYITYTEEAQLIHFKGESTRKTNWKYQTDFFNAMRIYWSKNSKRSNQKLLPALIYVATQLLKIFSWIKHTLKAFAFPVFDFFILYLIVGLISQLWALWIKSDAGFFPQAFYLYILPIYTFVWVLSLFSSRFYAHHFDIKKYIKGISIGVLMTLVIYFILPSEYKFSRAILLFSIVVKTIIPIFIRFILSYCLKREFIDIVESNFVCTLRPFEAANDQVRSQLREVSPYRIIELREDAKNVMIDFQKVSNQDVIREIKENSHQLIWLYDLSIPYFIQARGKDEDALILSKYSGLAIQEESSIFKKRIFDIIFSVLIGFISFLLIPFRFHKFQFLVKGCIVVLRGKKTWVSVRSPLLRRQFRLKEGIYMVSEIENDHQDLDHLKYYSLTKELIICLVRMFISKP